MLHKRPKLPPGCGGYYRTKEKCTNYSIVKLNDKMAMLCEVLPLPKERYSQHEPDSV
jgi:hypothetical protein